MDILVINAGSSSLKFKIFEVSKNATNITSQNIQDNYPLVYSGQISNITSKASQIKISDCSRVILNEEVSLKENHYISAIKLIFETKQIKNLGYCAVIHRVVHGGDLFTRITKLDQFVIDKLATLNDYAPLHQPFNLLIAQTIMEMKPDVPNYACFDTAFHKDIPLANRIYAIPWKYTEAGVKRYGFHGLSYEFIAKQLKQHQIEGKFVIAHLGSGCSLCAISNGKSIATSMGFSTLDGIPMMTRSGEVDAQIPLFLQDRYKISTTEILQILNSESGLLGICGLSDMQEILATDTERTRLAIEMFCKNIAAYIAKLVVFLSGLDGIVFTGGIGENSPEIRAHICNYLSIFGIKLSKTQNQKSSFLISTNASRLQIFTIKTNEELTMLSQYKALISSFPTET